MSLIALARERAFDSINAWLDARFDERLEAMEFYRLLFPAGYLETVQERDERKRGKYGAIAVCIEGERVQRRTITDELGGIEELIGSDGFCLMSPISYAGKAAASKNARELYALAIDLDNIVERHGQPWGLVQLWYQIADERCPVQKRIPRPTAIVSSGTGVHLYFMLEQPLKLFPAIVSQLREMRRQLILRIWSDGTTTDADKIQFEGPFQSFRMVGSRTKLGRRCVAWKTGARLSIEELNRFVDERGRVDSSKRYAAGKVRLPEAAERWPLWYQRRVIEKQPRKTWTCNRALYDWWREKGKAAKVGHRYHSMLVLVVYAIKCAVGFEELRNDMRELAAFLDISSPKDGSNDITEQDIRDALAAYQQDKFRFSINKIEYLTGIRIERNKRNGRTRAEHIKIMNFIRDEVKGMKDTWHGRKPKQEIVAAWRAAHPDGRKIDCERETGLSRHTVLKWWNADTSRNRLERP